MMMLGKGAAARNLINHSINPRSSTESEIEEVNDHMPGFLWTLRFLGGQGFKINENIVHKDKKSKIFMESKGKYLCVNKTRHIDIRYFFINNRIE